MKRRHRKNCKLSVNINKIATLRNSRGGDVPNVCACAADLIKFGAEGITIHPRPDGRHIRTADVMSLARLLKSVNGRRSSKRKVEFNIEGYPDRRYLTLIKKVRPDQATLVPDPPEALTSNAGWQMARNERSLRRIILQLRKLGIRTSIFVDPFKFTKTEMAALTRIGPDRIELYTERYAKEYGKKMRPSATRQYAIVAAAADGLGIAVNAGHDLNSTNLRYLLQKVPQIIEVSIGHALISEALYLGFQRVINLYKKQIRLAKVPKQRA